jgi:hypothetical protein
MYQNPMPDTPLLSKDDTPSPQFEEVSKLIQAAQVEQYQIQERSDWISRRESTNRAYFVSTFRDRVRILINEAQYLDYKYVQIQQKEIRGTHEYERFLFDWREKWNVIRTHTEVILRNESTRDVISHLSAMRLFQIGLQTVRGIQGIQDKAELARYYRRESVIKNLKKRGKFFP